MFYFKCSVAVIRRENIMLRNSVNIKSGIEGSEIDPYNVDFCNFNDVITYA